MELLVCFKIVRDLDSAILSDWENARDISFDIDYTKKIFGCYDESALELALCIADQAKKLKIPCNVTALTIDDEGLDSFITGLYAVQFSEVIRISCHADLRFNPRTVSKLISNYVSRTAGFDAIMLGHQAGVGDHGQTAALTAEQLHLPCINMVKDIQLTDDGFVITSQLEEGIREATVTKPAVYAIGNSELHTYLRIPTLRDKLRASKCAPKVLELDELGLADRSIAQLADTEVLSFASALPKKNCTWIDADTDEKKAHLLYENYLRKVAGQ
jgi:electron transfer flavoprotein alpha/beta subunit